MERDSVIYKLRRTTQVIAHKFVSNETMSKFYYRIVLKKKLNLDNPKTFNEKLQWMKLYYYPNNPLVVKCADKFAVREYIESRGYKDLLVPLLGSWERADDIEWEILPDKYVLKCNHGCAYNIVCTSRLYRRNRSWLIIKDRIMGIGNVHSKLYKLMRMVFRIILQQLGELKKRLNQYKPTHSLPIYPSLALKLRNAI